jgi:hypothetical protein
MPPTSPEHGSARPPHPLAVRLIQALGAAPARVIDVATGSGRNARALRAAGFEVVAIGDGDATPQRLAAEPRRFAAAISTHGLLHGTPASIGALLHAVAERLEPGGLLHATFGSTRDARCGQGTAIEPYVYAPADGDERGVPHAFYDEPRLRALLEATFDLDRIEERDAGESAGAWAHARPLERAVHWFVEARKR